MLDKNNAKNNTSLPGDQFYHLTSLRVLRAREVGLTGPIPFTIVTELPLLEELDIANNPKMTGDIPLGLFNKSSLSSLDLSGLEVSVTSLPDFTVTVPVINLSSNEFEDTVVFPDDIGSRWMAITSLTLDNVGLKGNFPLALSSLTTLKYLSLAHNRGIVGSLPEDIASMTALQSLLLNDCSLSGQLPVQAIVNAGLNLQELNIACNNFTGRVPVDDLVDLSDTLTSLTIGHNNWTAGPLKRRWDNCLFSNT